MTKKELRSQNSEVRILNALSRHESRVLVPEYWSGAPEFIRGEKENFSILKSPGFYPWGYSEFCVLRSAFFLSRCLLRYLLILTRRELSINLFNQINAIF